MCDGVKTVSSSNGFGNLADTSENKQKNLGHSLIPHTGINSKWTEDLNVRPPTTRLPGENRGDKLLDTGLRNSSLDTSPRARKSKLKTNNWDHVKLKSFRTAKETISKTQRPAAESGKIFGDALSDKGLIFKKELVQRNVKKPPN